MRVQKYRKSGLGSSKVLLKKTIMSARGTKDKRGFTTAILRIEAPQPPKESAPIQPEHKAEVIFIADRARPERIRESLKQILITAH